MSDVVVVLPGILGSTLASNGTPVWSPTPGAVLRTLATFGRNITALTLPAGIGDAHPGDGVEPTGLMPDLHVLPGIWTPIKGYDRLLDRITSLGYRTTFDHPDAPPGNLVVVPYDWRLSNRYNARRLGAIVEPALDRWRAQGGPHTEAQLVFVAHSMGGLIARRYIECEGGAAHTRKLITLGTPYRGAASTVEQLVNGVRKGLGRFALDLTAFARSLPSLHQLLPEYACLDTGTGPLLRTTQITLPDLTTPMITDAMAFHDEINTAAAARPDSRDTTHAILGARQPTTTTIRIADGRAEPLETYRDGDTLDNDYGDATVPTVGGITHGLPLDTNRARHIADRHGNLQRNTAALDEVQEAITTKPVTRRDPHRGTLRVRVPDLIVHGEPLTIQVDIDSDDRHAVQITTTHEDGRLVDARTPRVRGGATTTTLTGLDPGAYTIHITATDTALAPVTATVLVWPAS